MKSCLIILVVINLFTTAIKADEYTNTSKIVSVYHTLAHEIIIAEPNLVSKQKAVEKLDNLIYQAKQILKTREHYSEWQSEEIFRTIYMLHAAD